MHLLDRQMGTEAREALSHVTKTYHQNQSNKNDPPKSAVRWWQWTGGWESVRKQESLMGKSLQDGPGPAKGWGRHVWDSWEGTGINRAVSHRPERANGLCLSLHLSPTGQSLASRLLGHQGGGVLPVRVWPGAPSSSSHSPLTLLLNAMCFAVTYLWFVKSLQRTLSLLKKKKKSFICRVESLIPNVNIPHERISLVSNNLHFSYTILIWLNSSQIKGMLVNEQPRWQYTKWTAAKRAA